MSRVDDAKAALRREARERLRRVSGARSAAAGALALALAEKERSWREARTVCAYLPMSGEIDTMPLCRASLSAGKALCLPRTGAVELDFRYSGVDGPWAEGPFGIREPLPDSLPVDFARAAGPLLVVVPGLAFDASGARLGRGKGYYDRFLKSLRLLRSDAFALAFALPEQLVAAVPADGRDEPVDRLIVLSELDPGRR